MNKIDPSVLERLKPIAIPNGWDIVRRVGVLMDKAVYQLSNSYPLEQKSVTLTSTFPMVSNCLMSRFYW